MGKVVVPNSEIEWFDIIDDNDELLLNIAFRTAGKAKIAEGSLKGILSGQRTSGYSIYLYTEIVRDVILELSGEHIEHGVSMLQSGGIISNSTKSRVLTELEKQTKLAQSQEVESQKEKEAVKTSPASELAQAGLFSATAQSAEKEIVGRFHQGIEKQTSFPLGCQLESSRSMENFIDILAVSSITVR